MSEMTPEIEAHWRYQLERMTNWGHGLDRVGPIGANTPDEVRWLREEARYHCHLANAKNRRAATFVGGLVDQ